MKNIYNNIFPDIDNFEPSDRQPSDLPLWYISPYYGMYYNIENINIINKEFIVVATATNLHKLIDISAVNF